MTLLPLTQFPFAGGQVPAFLVILMRVAGILAAVPAIGARTVPLHVRIGLVLGLSVILLPVVGGRIGAIEASTANLLRLAVTEFLVGMALGLCVRFVFTAFEIAGELLGIQMGIGIASVLDPVAGASVPLLGRFLGLLAFLLFFALDGHHLMLEALAESFALLPPMTAQFNDTVANALVTLALGMFVLALKVAAPVMTALFVVTFAMGILGRTIPQLNLLLNNVTVTFGVGLLVLGLSLPLLGALAQTSISRLGPTFQGLLVLMGQTR